MYGRLYLSKKIGTLETILELCRKILYKALHELQRIQASRAGKKPPAPIAIDVDVSNN